MRLYCTVCTSPIPDKRAAQRANTCSPDCKKKSRAFFRAMALARKCRHCNKPSTAEERADFQRWKRERAKQARAESKTTTAGAE